jgi:hypothetical protein
MQCPNGIADAHIQKQEKNYRKENSRYSELFFVAAVQPPPRQHQKSSFSNSDVSKKETMHRHRPIIVTLFYQEIQACALTKH